jgi:hypothetical protein
MIANFDQAYVPLDRALFLKLTDAAGTTVRSVNGCLWVTRDRCLRDFVLTPGQGYVVKDGARVMVTAFGPSLVQVSRPSPARSGQTSSLIGTARHKLRALMVLILGFPSSNVLADSRAPATTVMYP